MHVMIWLFRGFAHSVGRVVTSYFLKANKMYQIVKVENKTRKSTLMLDSQDEVLEYENYSDAKDMCDILNANAKGYTYNVKEIK